MNTLVAPGKLLVSGAYAVLEGAPAVAIAIDRYATVALHGSAGTNGPREFAHAGVSGAPDVDLAAFRAPEGRKLGLGSSAASYVLAVATRGVREGWFDGSPSAQARVGDEARTGHRALYGGSGVDCMTIALGGCVEVEGAAGRATRRARPASIEWFAIDLGRPARTTDALECFSRFRSGDDGVFAETMRGLCATAARVRDALVASNPEAFLAEQRVAFSLLDELGVRMGFPVVPEELKPLSTLVARFGAAVVPSGAGGGDLALVFCSSEARTAVELEVAQSGFRVVRGALDLGGVRAA